MLKLIVNHSQLNVKSNRYNFSVSFTDVICNMSWAANEWKDGLPHRALQKIGEMEKTVEKMQKERQQRQFQMDSIEQVNLYKLYTI